MTLSAQSLTKRYGAAPGYAAVRDASLELRRGEFISIVGRSGSGKSTLMAMLGALTRPTEGRLLLDGTDVWTLSETQRATFRARQIGFVFQFPSLLSNLTAADNVAVPALLGRTMAAQDAYARARDLLARVGLADRMDAYPGSMSGGEQRRVAVARALINAPPLLLADEPTSDLDEDTEGDIIDLLEELQRTESFGFVLVTHDLELAQRAERSFEMHARRARAAAA
jgi:ABC-type lipoprotein export system ATPase subunit